MIVNDIKSLLSSLKEEDFYKRADLHIHSNESDGKLSAMEILSQASQRNMEYIAICDHNSIDTYINTNILSNKTVIPAVEFDCFYKGTLMHIIGYGIDIDNESIRKLCAKTKAGKTFNIVRLFALRSPEKVIEAIKEAKGVAVWAHPACCWAFSLENITKDLISFGLEGIEVYYPYNGLRGILTRKQAFELVLCDFLYIIFNPCRNQKVWFFVAEVIQIRNTCCYLSCFYV